VTDPRSTIDLLCIYESAFLVHAGRNAVAGRGPETREISALRFSPNRQTTPVLAYEAGG